MRYVLAAVLAGLAGMGWALTPPLRINFQGKLTDPATGNPRNGSFTMVFRLYRAPTGGAAVFTETQNDVPVNNGVFSTHIGSTAFLSPDLLAHTSAYLSVEVGGDGEMAPRQQLVMSPYAYTAAQLMAGGDLRVNAATAYSTFTSAGNWLLPHGVTAATGTFSNTVSAARYTATYGVTAATAAFSTGISAGTGTFTAAGNSQFSVETASGARVAAGTLKVDGSGGVDATSVIAGTISLRGLPADPPGSNGKMIYNTATNRFRCHEEGAWRDCLRRSESVAFGGRVVLTNVGASYDAVALSRGLGIGVVDFTGATSVNFRVFVNKIGTGTQDWQLYNETDGAQIGVLSDAGGAGEKILSGTFSSGLPTGIKQVRVRARSTTAGDDPIYLGAAMLVSY